MFLVFLIKNASLTSHHIHKVSFMRKVDVLFQAHDLVFYCTHHTGNQVGIPESETLTLKYCKKTYNSIVLESQF